MKRVLYVSGTRADYGLMHQVLQAIDAHPELTLDIVATGMHLMPVHGETVQLIKEDGFTPTELAAIFDGTRANASSFMHRFGEHFHKHLLATQPDMLLLLGDRPEMLIAAVHTTYHDIPIVHLHGGDLSSTKDEHARHAITKLAHLHLAATEQSAQRILQMGEEPERVHVVGAPGVHAAHTVQQLSDEECAERFGAHKGFLLVLQHPSGEDDVAAMEATLKAATATGKHVTVIRPNADAGSAAMNAVIDRAKGVQAYANIPHREFLSLLARADALVGNSSAGIIEAGSFGTPVVNVGRRQEGRERGPTVFDSAPTTDAISAALQRAQNAGRTTDWTYYQPDTPTRVAHLLATTAPTLQKRFVWNDSRTGKHQR